MKVKLLDLTNGIWSSYYRRFTCAYSDNEVHNTLWDSVSLLSLFCAHFTLMLRELTSSFRPASSWPSSAHLASCECVHTYMDVSYEWVCVTSECVGVCTLWVRTSWVCTSWVLAYDLCWRWCSSLASFQGRRRNGLATSASSNCNVTAIVIQLVNTGLVHVILTCTIFPAVRMGLSCSWKQLLAVGPTYTTEVK